MLLSSTGVTNCEFHAGRAEKILPQLLKSQEEEKLTVAVVNPARAGLRKEGGQLGCSPRCPPALCLYSHPRLRGFLWGSPEADSPPFLSSPAQQELWNNERWWVKYINKVFTPSDYQVVQAIRNCRAIHTLVFVSCKPHGESTRNFIEWVLDFFFNIIFSQAGEYGSFGRITACHAWHPGFEIQHHVNLSRVVETGGLAVQDHSWLPNEVDRSQCGISKTQSH